MGGLADLGAVREGMGLVMAGALALALVGWGVAGLVGIVGRATGANEAVLGAAARVVVASCGLWWLATRGQEQVRELAVSSWGALGEGDSQGPVP